MISGYFSNTLANAVSSSLLYTEPLGLQGELNHIILVFGVMAASSWVGVILKSFSIDVGTQPVSRQIILQFQNSSPSKGLVKLLHHHHLTLLVCYIKIVLLLWNYNL
jgi:hypothetical protein